MKERPSWPMQAWEVRAILEGRKTQTRRVVMSQPSLSNYSEMGFAGEPYWNWIGGTKRHPIESSWKKDDPTGATELLGPFCPYGQPVDRLWVRETWAADNRWDGTPPRKIPQGNVLMHYRTGAKGVYDVSTWNHSLPLNLQNGWWRSPIHMPRWASRITLEITKVRVERLKDISEADAKAEGVRSFIEDGCHVYENALGPGTWHMDARSSFSDIWNSLHAKDGHGWDANPWVWIIEFKRGEAEGADMLDDGCGNIWSKWCPECKKDTMEIVRPGKVQCGNCG